VARTAGNRSNPRGCGFLHSREWRIKAESSATCHDFAARKRSYALLAEAFGLESRE
jgi:hypothetical protein